VCNPDLTHPSVTTLRGAYTLVNNDIHNVIAKYEGVRDLRSGQQGLHRSSAQRISMAGQSLKPDLGLHVAHHRCQTILSVNIMQIHRVNHVSSADLGGSSKYSYETYEDKVKSGNWFHDNSLF